MPGPSAARRGRRPDPALRDLWRRRLARFGSSGLSAATFCAQEGVSLPSFYAWRRRLGGPTAEPPASQAPPASRPRLPGGARLVPVRILDQAPAIEVCLAAGATLRLSPGCDLDFVRALVAALGGAPR